MKTKAFPIENVLTVYTGVCMKQGVGVAQDVFDHLYPGIMTIGCAAMQSRAAKVLEAQHPLLAGLPAIGKRDGDYLECLAFARAIFGDTILVSGPVAVDDADVTAAFDEFGTRGASRTGGGQ